MKADICIIGAGSGGLFVASGAAQLGLKTVLIEKGKMGGDCLNYGCVPSKALIAAAKKAHAARSGGAFGIAAREPEVDWAAVHAHVQDVIAAIAPHDSVERFEGLGVHVVKGEARFTGPREVEVGGERISARRFVIATGSSPAVPAIDGLAEVAYFTNETLFDNTEKIGHLLILGGGPIGMEMAQAHRRLGAAVTVIERGHPLSKDDPDLARIVTEALEREGVKFLTCASVTRVAPTAGGGITVTVRRGEETTLLGGSHLLVAAGRRPNLRGLDLEAAGIAYDERGITVDASLRTSNRRVYAIGDVAGSLQFTHMAGYHAGLVIRHALFKLPIKASTHAIPWTTYTDPELAHVGLSEAAAAETGVAHKVLTWSFEENDRAVAERRTEGRIKVVVAPGGRILGATIAGPQAGELIQPWVLAITSKLKISAFTSMVAPYPTLGEVSKRTASSFYAQTLFSPRTRLLVRLLSLF